MKQKLLEGLSPVHFHSRDSSMPQQFPFYSPLAPQPVLDSAPPLRGFIKHTATVNVKRSDHVKSSNLLPAATQPMPRKTGCSSTGRSCKIEVTSPRHRCRGRFNTSGRLRSHDGETRFLLTHSQFMIHSQERIGFLSHCSCRLLAVRAKNQ